jgi:pyruvate dehydrogenase E2 component (dihydrolipoamide acetyltransferase)
VPTNVILPALGMAQDTGKILGWLKAEGEMVQAGEALAVIETDKASMDLEAPADGVLARISAPAGAEVPVGQVIALILTPEEAGAGEATSLPNPLPERGEREPQQHVPSSLELNLAPSHPLPSQGRGAGGVGLPASPKARRIAAERGIALGELRGSGPEGAVLAADVLVASTLSVAVAPIGEASVAPGTLSTTWRIMAERTTATWTKTPHFFLLREVNAGELRAWQQRLRENGGGQITVSDLLVSIVADTLVRHPRLRASWRDGSLVPSEEVNIGLAVATEDGLVVPVIHGVDDLNIQGIAKRRRELVERAQSGRLRPHDLEGGTFTISNLGMYGVDAFTAILNGGQAAILAVGRIADRVVPVDGRPTVQPMMTLTLSCDHRVVDGARGAQFLATLAVGIERPH